MTASRTLIQGRAPAARPAVVRPGATVVQAGVLVSLSHEPLTDSRRGQPPWQVHSGLPRQ